MKTGLTTLTIQNSKDWVNALTGEVGANPRSCIQQITLGDYIRMVKTEDIIPYENSRSGHLNTKRCEDIAKNFNIYAIGMFHLSTNEGSLQMLDAHHRTEALLEMYDKMDPRLMKNLDFLVPVRMVHKTERLAVYRDLNANKGLTGAQKINNPDFVLGKERALIMEVSGAHFGGEESQSVMDIAFAYEKFGEDLTLDSVISMRSEVTALQDTQSSRHNKKLSETTTVKIGAALKKLQSFKDFLEANPDYNTFEVKKVVKARGFLIAWITDYASKGNEFGGFSYADNKKIANRLRAKGGALYRYFKTIAKRNRGEFKDSEIRRVFQGI